MCMEIPYTKATFIYFLPPGAFLLWSFCKAENGGLLGVLLSQGHPAAVLCASVPYLSDPRTCALHSISPLLPFRSLAVR